MQYLTTLFGVVLLAVAVIFVRRLLRRQQAVREADPEIKMSETRFNISQCRRRIQCGVLFAALALGVMAEPWISDAIARVILGAAMLIVVGWMILLAVFDIILTNMYFRRMSDRYHYEQIRLEAQVKGILRQENLDVREDGEEEEDDEDIA